MKKIVAFVIVLQCIGIFLTPSSGHSWSGDTCHLDGSLRLGTLIELAQRHRVGLPSYTEEGLRDLVFRPSYANLGEYLEGFKYTVRVLQDAEALERTTFELCEDCQAEGVMYVELPITNVSPEVPAIIKHLIPSFDFLKGATLKVAVAHGTANARRVMEDIRAGGKFSECHFIGFMGSPGGCIGGGGQPIPTSPEIRAARARAIYAEDAECAVRKSHENPAVLKFYGEFLTDGPCGHLSHKLLHTHYTARGKHIG